MKNIRTVYNYATNTMSRALQYRSRNAYLLLLLLGTSCLAWQTNAQTVSHPLSEISTTIRHYSYTHMLSATEKKVLRYIIVESPSGDIKTVFDACDVCYLTNKGYSQSGVEVRCNNCGNRFVIDELGPDNSSGTCNPGYLPRTIEDGYVVIKISDLVRGEYYFPKQIVTGIDEIPTSPGDILLSQDSRGLTITLPGDGQRTFHIFGLNGQHIDSFIDVSRVVQIGTGGYTSGAYFLMIVEARRSTTKKFLVY